MQKRSTKLIERCKTLNYSQRLDKLGLMSLEDRHYRMDMIEVFKVLKSGDTIYPENFLELNDRPGRINSSKLFKKRNKLDILCKFSFTSRVVDLWNNLPDAVVQSADVNAFKHSFDRFLGSIRGLI